MHLDPECEVVAGSERFSDVEVDAVHYDVGPGNTLVIELESAQGGFAVVFDAPLAIRVIDESQVLEFWNTYSAPNGWLWRVLKGGWVDLESERSGFGCVSPARPILEYLIVGDQCVFVMTTTPPSFRTSAG